MLDDFNLMFDNAQQYNRPDSRIYRDAVKLQKYVQIKAEEIAAMDEEVRIFMWLYNVTYLLVFWRWQLTLG